MSDPGLAKALEATLLRPAAARAEIEALCRAAVEDHCAGVVVAPPRVSIAAALLHGSDVRTTAVVAFPFGAEPTRAKAVAAEEAVAGGADEIEVVARLDALADGDLAAVQADLTAVVRAVGVRTAAGGRGVLVKAVIETCYLDDARKRAAALAAVEAGCDLIVTSTGLGPDGATEADVALLREALPPSIGVKAVGRIHSLADAESLLAAGATRLGTTSAAAILAEARAVRRRR